MSRTSPAQLHSMVEKLNKKLNRPLVPFISGAAVHDHETPQANRPCPGHLFVENIASYGGWTLCEVTDKGGERHPLGNKRHTAGEMWDILYAVTQVVLWDELQPIPPTKSDAV